MKIRGERECRDCGTRWSYFETGSIGCPACGSLRSVGTDDRSAHTDGHAEFDLTPVRDAVDAAAIQELATQARDQCREYVRNRGFVSGGQLRELDDTYLAAAELRHVAEIVARNRSVTDAQEHYLLSVLRDADVGERQPPAAVPDSLREGRGLGYANAIRDYRRDVRTWAVDSDLTSAERSGLETLGEHVTRVRMLDGDVDPTAVEGLVAATRALANGLRGDEVALTDARERLESFDIEPPA